MYKKYDVLFLFTKVDLPGHEEPYPTSYTFDFVKENSKSIYLSNMYGDLLRLNKKTMDLFNLTKNEMVFHVDRYF